MPGCWPTNHGKVALLGICLGMATTPLGCKRLFGTQPGCLVQTGGPLSELESGESPTLDLLTETGPHPVWTTQPDPSCNENPRIPAASSDTDLELLISYPAASDPLESGYGDVAPGQWPLVLFAHANTYADCHLVDDYPTLHKHWASWGFIVVSVDASALCVKNSKANLEGRRDDLLAAWTHVIEMGNDTENLFYNRLDSELLVLAGHSRGATAALLAIEHLPEADGLIWLQGVDTAGYQLGRPQVNVPALGVVAGLDQDIRFPKAEPTKDQLVGAHAWTTLLGGIHAFTSDTIDLRKKDEPELKREEQLALTTELSTLLLAATVGASDGAKTITLPEAHEQLFGPGAGDQHSAIHATWERAAEKVTWLDDFQNDSTTTFEGGRWLAEPADSATRSLAWNPDEEEPGTILGDAYALEITGNSKVRFEMADPPEEEGLGLPRGSLLGFLVKDLEDGVLTVQIETDSEVREHTVEPAPSDVGPLLYRQVEIDLADSIVTSFTLELTEGRAMVDDFRLVLP